MKLNTPLPQSLPKECAKAARILQSFVGNRNQGLDGFIPHSVLEHAKGFAIFSVFKAGFVFSARAGSGIVIAKLGDGTWSAPSAIGTAGMGFGGQVGAEVTDFLIILNSSSAVKSFMAAGSLTLGGNMSVAVGPLGRNGEATSALNTSGSLAAMYSYSKTKGLFGGLSIEGSVIVERQDANALAYESDVTAKMLLSGAIPPPDWARDLVRTLENCTGPPGGRKWVQDNSGEQGYAFGGMAGPGSEAAKKKTYSVPSFPPTSWGKGKDGGSFFTSELNDQSGMWTPPSVERPSAAHGSELAKYNFPTRFESSLSSDPKQTPMSSPIPDQPEPSEAARSGYSKSPSMPPPYSRNPFLHPDPFPQTNPFSSTPQPGYATTTPQLAPPLASVQAHEGPFRAIALFDFKAIQPGDLALKKGDVILVTEKSDSTDDWWTGIVDGRRGIFPANFVELV